jgi:hypothetical protein
MRRKPVTVLLRFKVGPQFLEPSGDVPIVRLGFGDLHEEIESAAWVPGLEEDLRQVVTKP